MQQQQQKTWLKLAQESDFANPSNFLNSSFTVPRHTLQMSTLYYSATHVQSTCPGHQTNV